MKNINHTRSSIRDDISNILCSSANMRRAIPLILRLLMNLVNLSTNLASHFFDLVIGKILTSRLSLSKHLAHSLGNLLFLGKIGVFHNRRNASSRLLLLISLNLTEDDFDFLTSNKVWIATDRSRARRCVEACVYGTLDFVGYPRFPAPVEFIAAVIAYYVHPVNIQTACLIMEG